MTDTGMTYAELLASWVASRDRTEGCWIWPGSLTTTGYGQLGYRHQKMKAHRVAVELDGRDVQGLVVRHTCHTPQCVNPGHLETGTHADNYRDMVQAGRVATVRGEQHYGAKLTEADVLDIRRRYANGETQVSLGSEYGVAGANIGSIIRREIWAHVPPEPGVSIPDRRNIKLTEADVLDIRRRYANGESRSSIAATFDVRFSNVCCIIRRDIWAHLPAEPGAPAPKRRPKSKLTKADVIEIRRRHAKGEPQVGLATEFGVAQNTISNIVHRKRWAHV